MNCPTVIADMFNERFVISATTLEDNSTHELKECIENLDNNDDNMFAYPTHLTEAPNTFGQLENKQSIGIDGVPSEVHKPSLPLFVLFRGKYYSLFVTLLDRGVSSRYESVSFTQVG